MTQDRIDTLKAIIIDVDGVLTDSSVFIDGGGEEIKRFHVRDGGAITWLLQSGFKVAWLSGRSSAATAARAEALGVQHLVQGRDDKLNVYHTLKQTLGVSDEEVCYMGDDLHDLAVMARVGFAVTVPDAPSEVKKIAHHVTDTPGGHGAVRELAELILKHRNLWKDILRGFGARS